MNLPVFIKSTLHTMYNTIHNAQCKEIIARLKFNCHHAYAYMYIFAIYLSLMNMYMHMSNLCGFVQKC